MKHCVDYVEAVGVEAQLREERKVLDLGSYESLRRENSAVRLCFALVEYVLGIDLPDDVFDDSEFMRIYWTAVDMVCWSNVSSHCRFVRFTSVTDFAMILNRRTSTHTTWSNQRDTEATTT